MLGINQRLAIIREAFIKKTPATPIKSNETGLLDDTVSILLSPTLQQAWKAIVLLAV